MIPAFIAMIPPVCLFILMKIMSRSASLVVAFLMSHRGMDLREAIGQVRRHREVQPNRAFLSQLVTYERQLTKPCQAHISEQI